MRAVDGLRRWSGWRGHDDAACSRSEDTGAD